MMHLWEILDKKLQRSVGSRPIVQVQTKMKK